MLWNAGNKPHHILCSQYSYTHANSVVPIFVPVHIQHRSCSVRYLMCYVPLGWQVFVGDEVVDESRLALKPLNHITLAHLAYIKPVVCQTGYAYSLLKQLSRLVWPPPDMSCVVWTGYNLDTVICMPLHLQSCLEQDMMMVTVINSLIPISGPLCYIPLVVISGQHSVNV